jgi:ribosomal protein S18 acetylase RimI-like enzyme
MISIRPLTKPTAEEARTLNDLIRQMRNDPASHTPFSLPTLRRILAVENTIVLVVRDGDRIIGTGTIVWNTFLSDTCAFVEDVVIDAAYRGRGLGKKLMRALITSARRRRVRTLALTSRSSRVAANALYQKLGFKRKETNYYEMDL